MTLRSHSKQDELPVDILPSSRKSCTSMTSTSLSSCFIALLQHLVIRSRTTIIVIREAVASRVGPTFRVSMLNPRPAEHSRDPSKNAELVFNEDGNGVARMNRQGR